MRLTKDTYEERIDTVRQLVVRNRNISVRELNEITGWSTRHCWTLRTEVFRRRLQQGDEDVKAEAKVFSETIELLCQECWKIINNTGTREIFNKDGEVVGVAAAVDDDTKLRAIDTLARNMKLVFDVKFDAGIFTKQLGQMQIKTFTAFVDLVKASINDPNAKPAPVEAGGNQSSSSTLPATAE